MSRSIKWYLNRVREYQKGDAGGGIRGFAVFPVSNALMLWATDKCQGACVIDPSFPVDVPTWYANARGDTNSRAYPMAQTAISQFLALCGRQGTSISLPIVSGATGIGVRGLIGLRPTDRPLSEHVANAILSRWQDFIRATLDYLQSIR